MEKLLILIGLPGSGKTTFAKEYNKYNYSRRGETIHIEFDEDIPRYEKYYKTTSKEDTIEKIISEKIRHSSVKTVVLDGLFLKNEDVVKLLTIATKYQIIKNVEIHFWRKDIEACLWNDRNRRNKNSEITIRNAEIEEVDVKEIQEQFPTTSIKLLKHDVVRKPMWKAFFAGIGLDFSDNKYITSDRWSLGGSWYDCWGGSGTVSPETQPTTFKELDDLLLEICPNMTFLQYKKIMQIIDTETTSVGDYYGGNVSYAYFKCDVERLYEELVGMGLIKEG